MPVVEEFFMSSMFVDNRIGMSFEVVKDVVYVCGESFALRGDDLSKGS